MPQIVGASIRAADLRNDSLKMLVESHNNQMPSKVVGKDQIPFIVPQLASQPCVFLLPHLFVFQTGNDTVCYTDGAGLFRLRTFFDDVCSAVLAANFLKLLRNRYRFLFKINIGPAEAKAFALADTSINAEQKYSLQGTTQGRYLTGGVPPVRFSM